MIKKIIAGIAAAVLALAAPALAGTSVIAPPPGWTQISQGTASSNAISFSSIPTTYSDLQLVSAVSSAFSAASIKINGTTYPGCTITNATINAQISILITGYQRNAPLMSIGYYDTSQGGLTCGASSNSNAVPSPANAGPITTFGLAGTTVTGTFTLYGR